MNISEFLSIAIVGVALSTFVNFVKAKTGASGMKTKAILVGSSIVLGIGFYFLYNSSWYQAGLMVLGFASAIYALFLRKS